MTWKMASALFVILLLSATASASLFPLLFPQHRVFYPADINAGSYYFTDLNVLGKLVVDGNFFGNRIYGDAFAKNDAGFVVVGFSAIDDYNRIRGLAQNLANGFSVVDSNIVAQVAGVYSVVATVSGSASGNGEFGFKGFVNDVAQEPCYGHKHIATGTTSQITFSCHVRLFENDKFNLRLDDHANPTNPITLYSVTVIVDRVGS